MRGITLRLLTATALTAAAATPAYAGPPWIAAEYPVNPYHQDTRGALLLVHAFHHGTAMQFPMTGVAEGMVNGKRQRITLQVTPTYRAGVFAVRGNIPTDGNWILVVNLGNSNNKEKAEASLIATLGRGREVLAVNVPTTMQDNWTVPRMATQRDIDQALRSAEALGKVQVATEHAGEVTLAGLGLFGLMLMGAALRRSRRR